MGLQAVHVQIQLVRLSQPVPAELLQQRAGAGVVVGTGEGMQRPGCSRSYQLPEFLGQSVLIFKSNAFANVFSLSYWVHCMPFALRAGLQDKVGGPLEEVPLGGLCSCRRCPLPRGLQLDLVLHLLAFKQLRVLYKYFYG